MKNNQSFFAKFKDEAFLTELQREIKHQHFGNSDRFFAGNLQDKWRDARLEKFRLEWLKDKRILDIGCGDGITDLLIAVKFQPRLIIGVDIDHRMIKSAITNMQKAINDQE